MEVHACCLMATHFQLLVRSPVGELSRAMKVIQNRQTACRARARLSRSLLGGTQDRRQACGFGPALRAGVLAGDGQEPVDAAHVGALDEELLLE